MTTSSAPISELRAVVVAERCRRGRVDLSKLKLGVAADASGREWSGGGGGFALSPGARGWRFGECNAETVA